MKCLSIRKWPERQQTKRKIIKLIIYCMLKYKESRVCCGHVQKNYKEKELVIIAEFHKKNPMLKLISIIKFHQFNCRLLMHIISKKKNLVEEMTLSLSQIVDDITILAIFFSVSHRISLTNTPNSRRKKTFTQHP